MKNLITILLLSQLTSCALMRAPKTVRDCYLVLKEYCTKDSGTYAPHYGIK